MKTKLKITLTAPAFFCLLISISGKVFEDIITSLFAFPFEQMGMGLRFLSTSSYTGNVIAVILYCIICLLPAVYFALRAYRKLTQR